jgi:hypothetical protein
MISLKYLKETKNLADYNKLENSFVSLDEKLWTFEWLCNFLGIFIKEKENCKFYCLNICQPMTMDDFHNIPNNLWQDIASDDKVNLLIYQATESMPYYINIPRWQNLKIFLKNKGIPSEKIYFICGDINAEQNHKYHSDEYWSKINVLGIDIFEIINYVRFFEYNKDCNYSEVLKKAKKPKKYNYLNLNRRMRPNKQALVFYQKKFGFLEDNLISSIWPDAENVVTKEEFDSEFNFDNTNYKEVTNFMPFKKQLPIGYSSSEQIDLWAYLNSKFSLVSESLYGARALLVSEKTYKPLMLGHPIIIYGCTGTLKHLQEKGYETFPELFDETYDNEQSSKTQLRKVLENLNHEVQISSHIIDKCKHNQQLFLSRKNHLLVRTKILEFLHG